MNPSQSPSQNGQFQHPGMLARPGTVQISRGGQIQQTLNQSPFSPQSQTPLSPLDQGYPGSPATQNNIDPFSRPSSENSQPDSFVQHVRIFFYILKIQENYKYIFFITVTTRIWPAKS